MEEKIKKSIERLNDHKIETNKMASIIENCIYKIKNSTEGIIDLENIAKTYEKKIYELYTNFEEQKIDFWESDFDLREPIISELNAYMVIGATLTNKIYNEVKENPKNNNFKRTKKAIKLLKIQPEIESIRQINDYIRNYNLENNINKTLVVYYQSLPEFFFSPGEIEEIYERVINWIENLNLIDYIDKENLDEIIKNKEEKCLKHKEILESSMTRKRKKSIKY